MDIGMDRGGPVDAGVATIGTLFQHIVNDMKVSVRAPIAVEPLPKRSLLLRFLGIQIARPATPGSRS